MACFERFHDKRMTVRGCKTSVLGIRVGMTERVGRGWGRGGLVLLLDS